MIFKIEKIIYLYVIICLALVTYMISYFFKERIVYLRNKKRVIYWQAFIQQQCEELASGKTLAYDAKQALIKKLAHVNQLIAFQKAVEGIQDSGKASQGQYYIQENIEVFQVLAKKYGGKKPVEKAYFAHVMAKCWQPCDKNTKVLTTLLCEYLNDATVYCRENVLQALCCIGDVEAVERALEKFNALGYFHHTKLLTDNLMAFTGDKRELSKVLWRHYRQWDEKLMVAIVQFITRCDGYFVEVFLPIMDDPRTPLEIRLAIIRYYKKYTYLPAEARLHAYVKESEQGNETLGIVATDALESYKNPQTIDILKQALKSKTWYIRKHAAEGLLKLGIDEKDVQEVFASSDFYAVQMFRYVYEGNHEPVITKSEEVC